MSRIETWLETQDETVRRFFDHRSKDAVDVVRALHPRADKLHSHRSGRNFCLFCEDLIRCAARRPQNGGTTESWRDLFQQVQKFSPNFSANVCQPRYIPARPSKAGDKPCPTGSVLLV